MKTLTDLLVLAEENDIDIDWFKMDAAIAMSVHDEFGDAIAIDPVVVATTAAKKWAIAHELGHCLTGGFYNRYATYDDRRRHETQASRTAIEMLIPFEEMKRFLKLGYAAWDIADKLNVPLMSVYDAYEYYTEARGLDFNEEDEI